MILSSAAPPAPPPKSEGRKKKNGGGAGPFRFHPNPPGFAPFGMQNARTGPQGRTPK
jgi:hypothetical protein